MKSEQIVYKCNTCDKIEIFIKESFGGKTPFDIEVKYRTNGVGFGNKVAELDFCSLKCLKEFVDKQLEKENLNEN